MASTKDQIPPLRQASLVALATVLDALAAFSDHFVVIGGWAPYLLLQKYGRKHTDHIGSADLDLVFNGPQLTPAIRDQIVDALAKIGCQQRMWDEANDIALPDSYWLPVQLEGRLVRVQIDIIGLDRIKPRRLESHYALALKRAETIKVRIGRRDIKVPVSGAAAVFAMKAIALNDRRAPKDAYDLYMMARYYKQGPESMAAELKPLLIGPPVKLAVSNVRRWFMNEKAPGPEAVVQFLLPDGLRMDQEQLRVEAYQTIKLLLDHLLSEKS